MFPLVAVLENRDLAARDAAQCVADSEADALLKIYRQAGGGVSLLNPRGKSSRNMSLRHVLLQPLGVGSFLVDMLY